MGQNSLREEASELLRKNGAVLIRKGKHEVYRLPGGMKFTRATTSSDNRADINSLCGLKNLLRIGSRDKVPVVKAEPVAKEEEVKDMPKQSLDNIHSDAERLAHTLSLQRTAIESKILELVATEEKLNEQLADIVKQEESVKTFLASYDSFMSSMSDKLFAQPAIVQASEPKVKEPNKVTAKTVLTVCQDFLVPGKVVTVDGLRTAMATKGFILSTKDRTAFYQAINKLKNDGRAEAIPNERGAYTLIS